MKQKKMSIIDATFEKHKKLVLEHLNTKKKLLNENIKAKFFTNVEIDPAKTGKKFGEIDPAKTGKLLEPQGDVEVNIEVEGSYEDGGVFTDKIRITAGKQEFVYVDGNATNTILFEKGEEIFLYDYRKKGVEEVCINPDDLKKIKGEANEALLASIPNRYDDYE